MSILGIFDIGKTAMFASQTALAVTSNNIANANTPDYSRQEVVLSISAPSRAGSYFVGRGVTTESVRRFYDQFVQTQLLGQRMSQGRSNILDQTWGQVEQAVNESAGLGLSTPLSEFFNAWNDVASNPESLTHRSVLLQKTRSLVAAAQVTDRDITATLRQMNTGIVAKTSEINALAADIANMNTKIVQVEAGLSRTRANDLRDQRDGLLTELSKIVGFTSSEDANGALTVRVGMRTLVDGARTNTLSTALNSEMDREVFLDGINITGQIQSGEISGFISARTDVQQNTLTPLRRLIASVTQEVNRLHRNGFGLDASTGNAYFSDLQLSTTATTGASIAATITDQNALTLDEYQITFDALSNYTVTNRQNGSVVASGGPYVSGNTISLPGMDVVITGAFNQSSSFTVSPLTQAITGFDLVIADPRQVAASSSPLELPGNNANAGQIAGLLELNAAGLGNVTFGTYYAGVISTTGILARAASDSLSFDDNMLNELQNRRDGISSVSLDEEAANMIRYQRSYEASARMISVADELLQTVLNL